MSRYPKSISKTITAKSVSEASEQALAALGCNEDEAKITVIEEGVKGFLGIGAKDAVVEAEIIDVPARCVKEFLSDIFAAMKLDTVIKAKTVDAPKAGDEGVTEKVVEVELCPADDTEAAKSAMGIIIGKRGDTLDGLQQLSKLVLNQHQNDNYIKVSIDVVTDEGNYRAKREESLKQYAARLEAKVAKSGRKYTLEPMTPYERRIIHASLQDSDTVTTYSIDTDPYRKVVIAPKNAKPYKPRKKRPNGSAPAKDDSSARAGRRGYAKDNPQKKDVKPNKQAKPKVKKTVKRYVPDPDIPTTYKAGMQVNKRPETKTYKTYDEYIEGQKKEEEKRLAELEKLKNGEE